MTTTVPRARGTRPHRAGGRTNRAALSRPVSSFTSPPRGRSGEEQGEQPILSIRARIGERQAARFIGDALADIRAFMQEHDARPAGPPFSFCRPAVRRGIVDVEAGWPVERPIGGSGRIHSGTLPPALVRGRMLRRTVSERSRWLECI